MAHALAGAFSSQILLHGADQKESVVLTNVSEILQLSPEGAERLIR